MASNPNTPRVANHSNITGQIYIPLMNWGLLLAVILVVNFFGSSSALAGAYGIAVTGTMVITTLLTCTLAWRRLAAKGGAVDLVPSRASAELFVYVASGEADLAAKGVTERVTAGMLILIPASQEHVTIKSAGAADVALVEFRPALR